jgi:thiol-disulfide isomerase/thioredoxin
MNNLTIIENSSTLNKILLTNHNVIVFIGSHKCHFCNDIKPAIELLQSTHSNIKIVHIDINKYDNVKSLGVSTGVPVFVFYVNNEIKSRVDGADLDKINENIKNLFSPNKSFYNISPNSPRIIN